MRDVSPPSGLPGDGRGDTRGAAAGGHRPRSAPRHLATGNGSAPDPEDGHGDDDEGTPSHRAGRSKQRNPVRTLVEWAAVIGCGVLIALTAQAFFVQAFWIPSPSMTPTLEVGDRVLVNKLSYKTHDVRRGDLIVFERPPETSNGLEGEIKDLIKRVVAVGGDSIEGRDGRVYVNGELIEEPYLEPGTPTNDLDREVVPEGTVFVMGDNRLNSEDSRVFGPIDEDTIIGRAVVKVLPLTDLGWL
ncbi:MAG TPA: signal peptidase I [Acidimicrobiales bacterium]|nr:signal peptidase I [Acidimicrobiales bacterium]